MKYRSAFCTVDAVIRQLEISTNSDNDLATTIDTLISTKYANRVARIKELIYEVSERVYGMCQDRTFIPYIDTITYRRRAFYKAWHVRGGDYYLDVPDDLLSISSITWVGSSLSSTYYRLGDENIHPNWRIEIDPDGVSTYPSDFDESVQVTATFGYHENPDALWLDSGDTVQNATQISASGTSLTVTSGDNFETYQYIRIEDEFCFITSISGTTLTIERGVNGSTAAIHANATQIDILQIDERAENAVRRLVVSEYHNPGEVRHIVPLPDGTIELQGDSRIPLPPKKFILGHV